MGGSSTIYSTWILWGLDDPQYQSLILYLLDDWNLAQTWTFEHSQKSTNYNPEKWTCCILKLTQLKRNIVWSKPPFWEFKMFIFQGAPPCNALQLPKCKKTLKKPSDRLAPRGFGSSSKHRGRQAKESRCGFPSAELMFQHFRIQKIKDLGGGFKYFLFSPLFREDFQFD